MRSALLDSVKQGGVRQCTALSSALSTAPAGSARLTRAVCRQDFVGSAGTVKLTQRSIDTLVSGGKKHFRWDSALSFMSCKGLGPAGCARNAHVRWRESHVRAFLRTHTGHSTFCVHQGHTYGCGGQRRPTAAADSEVNAWVLRNPCLQRRDRLHATEADGRRCRRASSP